MLVAGYVGYRLIKSSGTVSIGYDPTGNGSTGTTNNTYFSASAVAADVYDAMKEMNWSDTPVFEALKGLSPAQFSQVYSAFGSPPYNSTTGNIYIPIWASESDYKENLKVWLKSELSASNYAILKKKFASTNLL